MSEVSNFRVGYLRTLAPVPSFGTYGDDRGYGELHMLLGGKLTLRGYLAFDYLSFYARPRNDANFTVDLGPDYQITSWLIASAGYVLSVRASTQSAQSDNFTRHEVYARFELSY